MVIRWTNLGTSASGEVVARFFTKEEARKECFRLNGWNYKEPSPVRQVIYKSNMQWKDMPGWLKFVVITNINPRMNVPVTDEAAILGEMRDEIAECIRSQQIRVPVLVEVREDEGEKVLLVMRSGRVLISVYVK